jgi:xanthine dehydrogenase accessory factor
VTEGLDGLARELAARGEPYVLATVVWRRSPSSGQVGSKALITVDGHVRGWVGGACAEPSVVSQARAALEDGVPRLVFLGSPEEIDEHRRDGVVAMPITCQSEGALEVYVEPVFPSPHLVVIGRSPAVDSLARMATALGWRAVVVDDHGSALDHPGVDAVVTSLDLTAAGVDDRSFVVVATQGHYDEDALEHALTTPAAYVGLVASNRRADGVVRFLRDRGVTEEELSRVHAPAGLDLGHISPQEIAVAVLADLVQRRASGAFATGPAAPAVATSEVHEALDPVCGMTVAVATARYRAVHEGLTYYFCSAGCQAKFEADPRPYLAASTPS